ncbi:hypothetical protein [Clavibacter sp. VKM Ac-2872]|uniref:hypothetical protein n=1 Tax=Clavibacter sp. VKM Ac-2872 TaxID=2783812 RepID=UPI00188BE9E9|nr:hypothetical protein [Clavibacter sp. VKM Ac-2872]MBF4625517.1 hypothetical protein [Clavibacter sp. VKM Ac-2872]
MSAPTAKVRGLMLARDLDRCAACGGRMHLEAQHRQATGMGGRILRPSITELLTLCSTCNTAAEGGLQRRALASGWKVRRWVRIPEAVPVFYTLERTWHVLLGNGTRQPIDAALADYTMRAIYGPDYQRGERP